ncbi:MAG: TrkH family potassium uptake protein [Alistipes sp.]|nr:TrkH family potassium uptake protein [Alistipes sp.]MEE1167465.1 TrkH family potassium uptake protein [Alistipes sp.]
MRAHVVIRYIGMVLVFLALFMLASAGVSLLNDQDSAFYPLLLSSFLTAILGIFPLIFVERVEEIKTKEGYAIVVGSWLVACVVGMIPYLIWGGEFTIVNAWFESVSGFTTTGASILNDIEFLPRGMLFWRSATTWIGGIGVVMFALVILPLLGRSRQLLYNVELSTIAKDNFHYRSREIMRILVFVYVGLTVVTTLLLKLSGMCWFDAATHAMSACGTSGFSTKNASVAFFDSPMIELVMMGAMAVSGIHFGILYATITGRRNNIFRSEIVRAYIGMMLVCSLVIAASLYSESIYPTFVESLRHASFQVVSLTTTSGFATANTNLWTPLAIILLVFCSIICGCAGSTSGGVKVDRLVLALKVIRNRIKLQQHPNAVISTKTDGMVQPDSVLTLVLTFIVAYLILALMGTIVYAMFGCDIMTSLTASISCISNVGPGFGEIGSFDNYADLPLILKLNSTVLMLVGRLEIFGFIQLFFLRSWR